jgi:hypothetical protein
VVSLRRKPKVVPRNVIKVDRVIIHDPRGDERRARVEVDEILRGWVACLPPLAVRR